MSEKVVEEDDNQDLKSSKMKLFRFLSSCDLFGIPIDLIYKHKTKHTTRFGGFVSLVLCLLIALQVYNVLDEVYQKKQPQVIFEEKIVESPSRNDLTKDNFTFVFGILDAASVPFIDETIYKVKGEFRIRSKDSSVDESNGQTAANSHPVITTVIPLTLQPCQKEYFQSEKTMQYFLSLNYTHLYCMQLNESNEQQLFLQGQYDNDIFSFIRLVISRCDTTVSSNNCKQSTVIDNKLSKSTLQVYYTNQVVEVTNYSKPFKPMGQTQFWNTNSDFFQRISLMYRTVHIIDDVGILFSQMNEKKTLQFSSDRSFMNKKSYATDLFDITINLEKNKESQYIRYYLKLDKAASLLGGMFNLLLVLGALISKPYSKMRLNHKLINSTFDFASSTTTTTTPQLSPTHAKQIQPQSSNQIKQVISSPQNILLSASRNETQQFGKGSIINEGELANQADQNLSRKEDKIYERPRKSVFKTNQNSTENNNDDIQSNTNNIKVLSNLSSEENYKKYIKENNKINKLIKNQSNQQQTRDTIISRPRQHLNSDSQSQFEKNKIKITIFDYFLNSVSKYISFFRSEKSLMIQYSQEKLSLFTDIRYVINKLVELDKLKMLLLDENQLQIFNYIEKPLVDNKCIDLIRERSVSGLKEEENVNDIYRKNQNQNQQTVEEAFKKVYERQLDKRQLSIIDKKLVKLVDTSFVSKLMNQSNCNIIQHRNSTGVRDYSVSKKFELSQVINENKNEPSSQESPESQKQLPSFDQEVDESYNRNVYAFNHNHTPFVFFNKKESNKIHNLDSFESLSNLQINNALNKYSSNHHKNNTSLNKSTNKTQKIDFEQDKQLTSSKSLNMNGNKTPCF